MTAYLCANNVTKRYGSTSALSGAQFSVDKGEIVALMGPSGSGKSTLLYALAGIIPIEEGSVHYNNQRLDTLSDDQRSVMRRCDFGFVFQFGQLVPELTSLENTALPMMMNGVPRKQAFREALSWLKQVDLEDKIDHTPGELSGGEIQRIAIARAMSVKPQILFADEPTGALDSLNAELVMELMICTARQFDTTIVMVTHEPSIAAYADREVFLRDGKVTANQISAALQGTVKS